MYFSALQRMQILSKIAIFAVSMALFQAFFYKNHLKGQFSCICQKKAVILHPDWQFELK